MMDESDRLAERFAGHGTHLRAVAYRMLGSLNEVDDAVQETWLRLSRSDVSGIENLGGWLTTVLARVCLDMLRARSRRERRLDAHVPDPIVSREGGNDPEHEALLADSVGLALLVVLEALAPAERIAFVLHDMFDTPFQEVAHIIGRSPVAARKLASRARRRVQAANTVPDADLTSQREVIDAFLIAARDGDFNALLAVLDPDVVIRVDNGPARPGRDVGLGAMPRPAPSFKVRGARAVAKLDFTRFTEIMRPVLVNGAAGILLYWRGRPISVMDFTVVHGNIVAIAVLDDRKRLRQLDLTFLN
jgi:RNA polymerase sigma factor (sigma-70 family)